MVTKKSEVDISSIKISNLIAHDIPLRKAADPIVAIPLSEAIPPLPADTLTFFGNRLKGTLTKRGQPGRP